LDLGEESGSQIWRFLQGGKDTLEGPETGALERTQGLQGLNFSLGERKRMVLSEAVLDLAASEEVATDNLEGKTGSGEGRGC